MWEKGFEFIMDFKYVISWAFIIIGAILTFVSKPVLTKKFEDEEKLQKYIYIFKIIGMWLVIIGAVAIFILGGNFGAGDK